MKPFDTKGEYTPEEVKAALAGVNGTRQLSFRYERLDRDNEFVEDLDYIQSCTIENNALADIKRTAKFDILDTGSMNYLQDRIKPYVRVGMPEDETYRDIMKSLDPEVWWKLDDTTVPAAPAVKVTRATGLTYNTVAAADLVNLATENARGASVQLASGTQRSEYWSYINTVPSLATQIQMTNNGTVDVVWEVYSAASLADPLTLVRSTVMAAGADILYVYPFPSKGIYASRIVAQSTTSCAVTVTYYKAARLEDSSGKGVYGTGSGLTLGSTSVVADGGKSMSTTGGAFRSIVTNENNISLKGGATLNYWLNRTGNGVQVITSFGVQTGEFKFTITDNVTPGTFVATMEFANYGTPTVYPDFYNAITIPAGVLSVGAKMVTVSIDPANKGVRLFINGNLVGSFTSMAAHAPLLSSEYISYTYLGMSSTSSAYFDDYSIHSKGLPSSVVAQLYQKGSVSSATRSGYVEWPQGVFVLTSPSRAMEDGGSIHREVEGYDQLVVLKEDSFDYRYSVAAGAKYTDSVKKVLQSVSPNRKVTLTSDGWKTSGAAVILSEDSVTLPTTDANQVYVGTNLPYQLTGFDVSAKVTTPATGNVLTAFLINIKDGETVTQIMLYRDISNNFAGSYKGSAIVVPYSATTHAYWRMNESKGYINYESSTDGKTWTNHRSIKNVFSANATVEVVLYADHNAALVGSGMTKVSFNGAVAVPNDVTTSSAKLFTPMEWEPGTPKLTIVNDLLGAINYESATFDENGVFSVGPYVSPQSRSSGFKYATDSTSVITGSVGQTVDLFAIPNKWVVVVSDPERAPLVGTYTNTNPLSPTSTVSRGRTIVDYRTEQNAPDQTTLDAQAARLAFDSSQVYEVIEFETAIMPIHQNADVYNLVIDDLEIDDKYSETSWNMELSNGATMSHKIRKIVSI